MHEDKSALYEYLRGERTLTTTVTIVGDDPAKLEAEKEAQEAMELRPSSAMIEIERLKKEAEESKGKDHILKACLSELMLDSMVPLARRKMRANFLPTDIPRLLNSLDIRESTAATLMKAVSELAQDEMITADRSVASGAKTLVDEAKAQAVSALAKPLGDTVSATALAQSDRGYELGHRTVRAAPEPGERERFDKLLEAMWIIPFKGEMKTVAHSQLTALACLKEHIRPLHQSPVAEEEAVAM
jgi:hypothetical protein